MGQVNQESNLVNRVVRLEQLVEQIRKLAGATSTIISRGGLTLLNDSFVKMVDTNLVERLFIGHTSAFESFDQPVFYLRDAAGKLRFAIYDPAPVTGGYQPVVWIWDHLDHVAFTTDINGGVAEPWIPVPLYRQFHDSAFLDFTDTTESLPVSACNGGVIWEGRIGKVSHPRIQYDALLGRLTGTSGSPTYTFHVGGTQLDSFSTTTFSPVVRGPFDISSKLGNTNVVVQLKVTATGTGTDRIAMGMLGCYLRQT